MRNVVRRAGAGAALLATVAALIAFGTTGLADPGSPVTMTNVGSPNPVISGS